MDDFDDISDEERQLAAEFAVHLETAVHLDTAAHPVAAARGDSLADLTSPIVLLKNFERFELSAEARRRGRAEVEEWASQPSRRKEAQGSALRRWFYWLPISALAAFALVFGLNRKELNSVNPAATSAAPALTLDQSETQAEAGFSKLSPRFHAGETPRALLQAQAAVLAEREPGREKDEARDEFERQMRAYRGQLIASLEVGGR